MANCAVGILTRGNYTHWSLKFLRFGVPSSCSLPSNMEDLIPFDRIVQTVHSVFFVFCIHCIHWLLCACHFYFFGIHARLDALEYVEKIQMTRRIFNGMSRDSVEKLVCILPCGMHFVCLFIFCAFIWFIYLFIYLFIYFLVSLLTVCECHFFSLYLSSLSSAL